MHASDWEDTLACLSVLEGALLEAEDCSCELPADRRFVAIDAEPSCVLSDQAQCPPRQDRRQEPYVVAAPPGEPSPSGRRPERRRRSECPREPLHEPSPSGRGGQRDSRRHTESYAEPVPEPSPSARRRDGGVYDEAFAVMDPVLESPSNAGPGCLRQCRNHEAGPAMDFVLEPVLEASPSSRRASPSSRGRRPRKMAVNPRFLQEILPSEEELYLGTLPARTPTQEPEPYDILVSALQDKRSLDDDLVDMSTRAGSTSGSTPRRRSSRVWRSEQEPTKGPPRGDSKRRATEPPREPLTVPSPPSTSPRDRPGERRRIQSRHASEAVKCLPILPLISARGHERCDQDSDAASQGSGPRRPEGPQTCVRRQYNEEGSYSARKSSCRAVSRRRDDIRLQEQESSYSARGRDHFYSVPVQEGSYSARKSSCRAVSRRHDDFRLQGIA